MAATGGPVLGPRHGWLLVALGGTILVAFLLVGALLGDQLAPSLGLVDLCLLTGGVLTLAAVEIATGLVVAVPPAGRFARALARRIRPRGTLTGKARDGTRRGLVARQPAIAAGWTMAWGVVHVLLAVAIAGLAVYLGIAFIPVMEPRYVVLVPAIITLATCLVMLWGGSGIAGIAGAARWRRDRPARPPRLAPGTMTPLVIAAIVAGGMLAYPYPGYHLARWQLAMENAALGVVYNEHGGWANPPAGSGLDSLAATGWFRVEKVNGRYWFVDPSGQPFISKGVNFISYNGDAIRGTGIHPYGQANDAKYGTREAWGNATLQRLAAWHFNTAGAWCDWFDIYLAPHHRRPYTFILDLADKAGADWLTGTVADMWGDSFVNGTPARVQSGVFYFKNDPYCIGYFTDNELNWGSKDWASGKTLLELYLDMPSNATGRGVLLDFIEAACDGDIAAFNAAFGASASTWADLAGTGSAGVSFTTARAREIAEAWRHEVATQYFTICHDAIRAEAPDQLILGCRFATDPLDSVTSAAKGLVDVISFAGYGTRPPLDRFDRVFRDNDVPVLVEEFAFKAADSGLPNTRGAGPVVPSQHQRALLFSMYVREFMTRPYAVGYHWFQWSDQPAEGRFDGENSNFGLVRENDEPWTLLVDMMTATNLRAETLHAGL